MPAEPGENVFARPDPDDDQHFKQVVCADCGRELFFSANATPEELICPVCAGLTDWDHPHGPGDAVSQGERPNR